MEGPQVPSLDMQKVCGSFSACRENPATLCDGRCCRGTAGAWWALLLCPLLSAPFLPLLQETGASQQSTPSWMSLVWWGEKDTEMIYEGRGSGMKAGEEGRGLQEHNSPA